MRMINTIILAAGLLAGTTGDVASGAISFARVQSDIYGHAYSPSWGFADSYYEGWLDPMWNGYPMSHTMENSTFVPESFAFSRLNSVFDLGNKVVQAHGEAWAQGFQTQAFTHFVLEFSYDKQFAFSLGTSGSFGSGGTSVIRLSGAVDVTLMNGESMSCILAAGDYTVEAYVIANANGGGLGEYGAFDMEFQIPGPGVLTTASLGLAPLAARRRRAG